MDKKYFQAIVAITELMVQHEDMACLIAQLTAPAPAKPRISARYSIIGAKYYGDGSLNYKYCDHAFTLEEAREKYKSASGYPFHSLQVEVLDHHGRTLHSFLVEGMEDYS